MRYILWILPLFLNISINGLAQQQRPANDDIVNAIVLNQTTAFCSNDGEYNNLNATASFNGRPNLWASVGRDVWFRFTATKFDVVISITGRLNNNQNTLTNPLAALYTLEGNTNMIATEVAGVTRSSSNVYTYHTEGLNIGQTYYIRVSAETNLQGSFRICIDNFFPPLPPAPDCINASILCSMDSFTQLNVAGGGANNLETAGSCMSREVNSAWYQFRAATAGSFTFTITPTNASDDIDWVFYDLGLNGNCSNVTTANAIRCAIGSGIDCTPSYYKTGLSMTEEDLIEHAGCPTNQNGFVRFVDLVEGHTYALVVNNYSAGNNGFTIEFGGDATFAGPTAVLDLSIQNPCRNNQQFVFENRSTNYQSLRWDFGEGASIPNANTEGPFNITYNSSGEKTVILEAISANGCRSVTTASFFVNTPVNKPPISASKTNLCVGDVLVLSTNEVRGANYHWSGPNGFTSNLQNPTVNIIGNENIGTYTLFVQLDNCISETETITINSVDQIPIADFDIIVHNKCKEDQYFEFVNKSTNYNTLNWNFGNNAYDIRQLDNNRTSVKYTSVGTKTITLLATSTHGCENSFSKEILVEAKPAKPIIHTNQATYCKGDIIKLNVNNTTNHIYRWSGPDGFMGHGPSIEIPVNNLNKGGIYQVTATLGNCESDVATIEVPKIYETPIAKFKANFSFDYKFTAPINVSFTNETLFGYSYLWEFGDGFTSTEVNPNHTFRKAGTYQISLTASSQNNCISTYISSNLVIQDQFTLLVPNTFSPNGDGINDVFSVNIPNLKQYKLQIFNRYGSTVFNTSDIFYNWDGTYKNTPVPMGVYYYVINGINIHNKPIQYSGSVTIIR